MAQNEAFCHGLFCLLRKNTQQSPGTDSTLNLEMLTCDPIDKVLDFTCTSILLIFSTSLMFKKEVDHDKILQSLFSC